MAEAENLALSWSSEFTGTRDGWVDEMHTESDNVHMNKDSPSSSPSRKKMIKEDVGVKTDV